MNCPLCNTPMIIRPLVPEAKTLSMRAWAYCANCGHGLREAYQARLANLRRKNTLHLN